MVKSTVIIRNIDEIGRIVILKEIRTQLKIKENDFIEFYVDSGKIVLRKYEDTCIFCNKKNKLVSYYNKLICQKCYEDVKNLIK